MTDLNQLPAEVPVPEDDGAADHLVGRSAPAVRLASTSGELVALDELGSGRTVLYLYPMTGRPDVALPDGWNSIPGARGCTPEACGFRDHFADLRAAGAARVYGISSQDTAYQQEAVERLSLPFAMLSDSELRLAEALDLPTFTSAGQTLYKRLTLVVRDGVLEHVFYPVYPPDRHAEQVLDWLRSAPSDRS